MSVGCLCWTDVNTNKAAAIAANEEQWGQGCGPVVEYISQMSQGPDLIPQAWKHTIKKESSFTLQERSTFALYPHLLSF